MESDAENIIVKLLFASEIILFSVWHLKNYVSPSDIWKSKLLIKNFIFTSYEVAGENN